MGLETTATYIDSFNQAWPLGSDEKSLLDNHIRLIKTGLTQTFPLMGAEVSVTDTELNYLTSLTTTVIDKMSPMVSATSTITVGTVTVPSNATTITQTATVNIDISAGEKNTYYKVSITNVQGIGSKTISTGRHWTGSPHGTGIGYWIRQTSPSNNDVLVIQNYSGYTKSVSFVVRGWK